LQLTKEIVNQRWSGENSHPKGVSGSVPNQVIRIAMFVLSDGVRVFVLLER